MRHCWHPNAQDMLVGMFGLVIMSAPQELDPYYQQLGLTAQASPEQVREAYRQLARQVHPDTLPADTPQHLRAVAEQEFLRLQTAYRALTSTDPTVIQPSAQRPTLQPVAPTRSSWQIPMAVGLCSGAVLVLGVAGLLKLLVPSPVAQPPALSVAPAPPAPSVSLAPVALGSNASAVISSQQIDRFAKALLEMQPLLQATDRGIQRAKTSAERQNLEQQFEIAAQKTIQANGLTTEEYRRISDQARQDPQTKASIQSALQRLAPR